MTPTAMGRLPAVLGLLCGLAGCMVGPEYERPQMPTGAGAEFYRAPANWTDPNAPDAVGAWWRGFKDPEIDRLVAEALAKNYDLEAAAATVMEAQALLAQSHGARLPSAGYSASRTRGKSPSVTPLFPSEAATAYSQEISISYIADLFGRLRRAERAAWADLWAAQESRQALAHAIIAQVIRSRVQIAVQQRLLDVTEATIRSREATLEVVERRYPQGLVSPVDVYLARENISASRAAAPQIRQTLMLAQNSLDVLTGRAPGSGGALPQTLGEMPQAGPAPLAVPGSLLDRRPDVRAAEMQLRAATERVGFSVAQMFPDLTLTAAGGYRGDNVDRWVADETQMYSFIMGLAAPLYRGGQLKAGVEAAKARAQRAAANYAKVILTAMREVEDALAGEQTLQERIAFLRVRLDDAMSAESLAVDRYSRGLEGILTVLETERRRRLAENELILTQGQLFNARIDLYLALGGDWGVANGSVEAAEAQVQEKDTGDQHE